MNLMSEVKRYLFMYHARKCNYNAIWCLQLRKYYYMAYAIIRTYNNNYYGVHIQLRTYTTIWCIKLRK